MPVQTTDPSLLPSLRSGRLWTTQAFSFPLFLYHLFSILILILMLMRMRLMLMRLMTEVLMTAFSFSPDPSCSAWAVPLASHSRRAASCRPGGWFRSWCRQT